MPAMSSKMGRPPFNGTTAMTAAERQQRRRTGIEARLEQRLAAIEAELASVQARLTRLGLPELSEAEPRQALPDRAPLHSRW